MIRSLFVILAFLLLQACSVPSGLSSPHELPAYTKGAHIRVSPGPRDHIHGELIAVQGKELLVLPHTNQNSGPVAFHLEELHSFRVYYAGGQEYVWPIMVFPLVSLFHGWYALFTYPLNAIATGLIHTVSIFEYTLRPRDVSPEELARFARFPGGIPDGVVLKDIR